MRRSHWPSVLCACAVAAWAFAAAGCATSINHILADPSHYRDREVRVNGTVLDSYSIADTGAYRIGDDTGQIWVISDRGVPRKGARAKVSGTIREGFNLGILGDRVKLPAAIGTGLVLVEESHKASY